MRQVYARWAPVYDVVYDKMTRARRPRGRAAAMACGPRILEAGVGTGLSLGYYGRDAEVTASTSPRRCCAGRRPRSSATGSRRSGACR